MSEALILKLIELIIAKGVPIAMTWKDGMSISNPTEADIQSLLDIKKPEDF